MHLVRIGCSEPGGQAACLRAEIPDLAVRAAKQNPPSIRHRKAPHPGRRKRSLTAAGVISIDHPSMFMRRHRYAAVDMADDEVAVLVPLSHPFCVGPGCRLQVQSMGNRPPVDPLQSCNTRIIAELVDNRRIHHDHDSAVFLMHLVRHLDAQHGRVVQPALGRSCVRNQPLIDLVYASRHRVAASASADNRIDAGQVDVILLQEIVDNLHAVIQLIIDGWK